MSAFLWTLVLQAIILLSALIALPLIVQVSPRKRMWGFIAGLAGQPAWLVASWRDGQWGVLAITLWWTAWYCWGALKHNRRRMSR